MFRTQERGGNQDSAKEKAGSGPQFQVCPQLQHDHSNRRAVAEDVVLGALVAFHKSHPPTSAGGALTTSGSETATIEGYPSFIPILGMGNDDTASPNLISRLMVVDSFSLIWNPA
jgi:hypothetical protein